MRCRQLAKGNLLLRLAMFSSAVLSSDHDLSSVPLAELAKLERSKLQQLQASHEVRGRHLEFPKSFSSWNHHSFITIKTSKTNFDSNLFDWKIWNLLIPKTLIQFRSQTTQNGQKVISNFAS